MGMNTFSLIIDTRSSQHHNKNKDGVREQSYESRLELGTLYQTRFKQQEKTEKAGAMDYKDTHTTVHVINALT